MPQIAKHTRFITVEGGDGAGKSTAIATIKSTLEAAGHEVVLTREPGGTVVAEKIRNLILPNSEGETLCAHTETLLVFAARAQHLQEVIRPALSRGAVVLCDRFTDSSFAYQGAGRGLGAQMIAHLEATFVGLRPAGTILLDVPPSVGRDRAKSRPEDADRIEREEEAFFERVRRNFLTRAIAEPERFAVIDATVLLEQVQAQIRATIASNMDAWLA